MSVDSSLAPIERVLGIAVSLYVLGPPVVRAIRRWLRKAPRRAGGGLAALALRTASGGCLLTGSAFGAAGDNGTSLAYTLSFLVFEIAHFLSSKGPPRRWQVLQLTMAFGFAIVTLQVFLFDKVVEAIVGSSHLDQKFVTAIKRLTEIVGHVAP